MAQQDQCLQGRRGVTRSRDVQLQEEQQCVIARCPVAGGAAVRQLFRCSVSQGKEL